MLHHVLAFLLTIIVLVNNSSSTPIEWPESQGGNGHYYELIEERLNWEQANLQAIGLSWEGYEGHLVTVTSPEENAWVCSTFAPPTRTWMGGIQPEGSDEPGGGWQWVTNEPWNYTNWDSGQPDNAGSGQDALIFWYGCHWDDLRSDSGSSYYFLVEYDDLNDISPLEWSVEGGGNGHFYLLVSEGVTWNEAKVLAEDYQWDGIQGHLATITSQDENEWICLNFPGRFWLGGFQADGADEPDGGWQWVTGESWSYTEWHDWEPNNQGGIENSLVWYWPGGCGEGGQWNDGSESYSTNFLVEFGESEEEVSWPDDTALPSLVLKVEEDSGEHQVHTIELSSELPSPRTDQSDLAGSKNRIAKSLGRGGFAVFEVETWNDWVRSIVLRNVEGEKIGHIGFKIDDSYDNQEANAILFLHDELGEGWPWNPEAPPSDWHPIHDNWNYYDEGEYPVSMLVPPGFNIENVRQANEKPVLFVHGIAGYFNYWDGTPEASELSGDTYDTWRFCYPYDQPIQASGELLGKVIERLLHGDLVGVSDYQAERIDLVAHSMGGLVSRSWIQSEIYNAFSNVNTLLMFATPNHGSHISFRLYEEHVPLEDLAEVFSTHDAEAPAHRQMIPANSWIMNLNLISPKLLGRGAVNKDYLVVSGTRDIDGLPHTEITHQDDGVVAISSASMLQHGIPLALVDEEHRKIHKVEGTAEVVASFLDPEYNPHSPSFFDGSDSWVFEYWSEMDAPPGSRLEYYDESAGIIELNMDWIDSKTKKLALIPDNDILVLQKGSGSQWPLRRCNDDESGFFSRGFVMVWPPIYEIGTRIPARDYTVQFRDWEFDWTDFPPGWKWVPKGTCSEPIRFDPLCTTSAILSHPVTGSLACNAPNATPIEPTGDRSCEYGIFIDSSIDTIVFSLSSLDALPDHYPHEMILEDPFGQIIDPVAAYYDPDIAFFENLEYGPIQYLVEHPEAGYWLVRHEESIPSPFVMAYTYGSLTSELTVQPDFCEAGDTIICRVQLTGGGAYPGFDLALNGFVTYPDSTNPTSIGEIILEDLGSGDYSAELLEVVAGEYLFHLDLICTTTAGDTIRLSACESAFVSTDATPTQPDDGPDDGDGQPPDIHSTQLLGAWPNPFNPSVKVELYSAREQRIRVNVFDISGRRVRQLLDKKVPMGRLSVDWDGFGDNENSVTSGVYLIQFQARGVSDSRKVVLLK